MPDVPVKIVISIIETAHPCARMAKLPEQSHLPANCGQAVSSARNCGVWPGHVQIPYKDFGV